MKKHVFLEVGLEIRAGTDCALLLEKTIYEKKHWASNCTRK